MCPIREKALKVLLKYGVKELPVLVSPLCEQMEFVLRLYKPKDGNEGCCGIRLGKPRIYVNENFSPERRRFTTAHEIGHIVLGHVGKYKGGPRKRIKSAKTIERQANVFAAELLMPQCLLYILNVQSVSAVQRIFGVSREAAFYAFMGLQRRRKAGVRLSKLEKRVCRRFLAEYKFKCQETSDGEQSQQVQA